MAMAGPFRRLRVVLLGNVGSGKSASGNTLLDTSHFASKLSACPVTQQCEAETVNRARWKITVVDTPGLTAEIVTDTTKEKLLQCLQLSAPGPHVFLLVIPLGRFTQEEKDTVQRAAQLFKEHFYTFTIILFTFKDNLKNSSISDYISTAGESLQQLLQKCGHRYHAFNNNNPTEDDQAEQLLRKMNSLLDDNFRTYYTLEDRMREERMELACHRQALLSALLSARHLARHLARRRRALLHHERWLARHLDPFDFEPPSFDSDSDEEDDACSDHFDFARHFARHLEPPSFEPPSFARSPTVDLKEEFEKLKIHGLTEENLKKQADVLEKWKEQLESKEKRLNDREEQVRKQEKEMEEKKKLK